MAFRCCAKAFGDFSWTKLWNHCDDVERTRRIWSSSTTSTRWVLNSTNCSKIVPSVNEVWRRSPERASSSGSSADPPPCKTRRAFTFPVDNHQRTASQERLFWFRFDNEWIWVMDNVKVECRRNVYFCASEPQWRSKQTKKWKESVNDELTSWLPRGIQTQNKNRLVRSYSPWWKCKASWSLYCHPLCCFKTGQGLTGPEPPVNHIVSKKVNRIGRLISSNNLPFD